MVVLVLLGMTMVGIGFWGIISMVKQWREILHSAKDEQGMRWTLKARHIILGSMLLIVVGIVLIVLASVKENRG